MSFIARLFGLRPKVDYKELIQQGAVIVDVRTPAEFSNGNLRRSINIPLDTLQSNLSKIEKKNPVILCCASGRRSGSAMRMLKAKGYTAYNGGGWTSLERKIE